MGDELVIRDVREGDVEAIAEIAVAAWQPVFASFRRMLGEELFQAAVPDCEADKARQVRAACDPASRAHVCVAELAGRVVGFVTFYADVRPGVGEIGNNAVHPDYQGRGIAPAMYGRALDRLRAMGMRCVRVTTGGDPSHAPARRAYEKAGFAARVPSLTYYRML